MLVTHAANRQTASFDSSDSMLDTIYQITQRALENNMQSVLTDCPDSQSPGLIANIAAEFHAVPGGIFGGHEFLDEPVPTLGHRVRAPHGVTFSRFETFDGTQYAVYNAGPGSYRFIA